MIMNFRDEINKFKQLSEMVRYEANFPDLQEFELLVNKFAKKKFPWWKKIGIEEISFQGFINIYTVKATLYVDSDWYYDTMEDMRERDIESDIQDNEVTLNYLIGWNSEMREKLQLIFSQAYKFTMTEKDGYFLTEGIYVKPELERNKINEEDIKSNEPSILTKEFEISYKPNQEVKELQKYLVYDKKYYLGKFGPNRDGVDGKYGPYTKAGHEAYLKGLSPKEFEQKKVKIAQEYIGDVDDTTLKNEFNFHLIPDGKNNYRSAQIPVSVKGKDFLGEVIDKYKIKTIIRFNGDGNDSRHQTNHPHTSIEDERNVAEQKGINFYKLSSTRDQEKVNNLLSQGNVLIHCAHGADRTGGNVGGYLKEIGFGDTEKIWNYTTKYNGWNRMVRNSPNIFTKGGYLKQAQKFGVRDLEHAQQLSKRK